MTKKEIIRLDNSLTEALGLQDAGYNGGMLAQNPALNVGGLRYNVTYNLLTMYPWLLSYAYKQYGFLQTAIDQPIEDAFRGGVGLESATLSPDELELLKQTMEDGEDWERIKEAQRWGRLFGGGLLIANTDQKTAKKLNEKKLYGSRLEFISSDRWESVLTDPDAGAMYSNLDFHGEIIDRSRVCFAMGKKAPYYVRMRLQGWGLSFFEQTLPPIISYLKAQDVMLELLDESKIDVLRINGLANILMTSGGTEAIKRRVDIAAANKNYKSTLVMDKEDEYDQKQLNVSGMSELSKEIRIMIAACLRQPVSKIWGTGSSGFSSGEDDLENYNCMIESEIRPQTLKMIKWVVDLRCMQLFGRKVPDLTVKWQPLRVLSGLDEQQKINQIFNNVFGMVDRQLMLPSEAMEYLKNQDIITMDTKALNGDMDEEYTNRVELIEDRSGNEE
jgi:phage-related protein (TIGR01555 family)